MTAVVAILVGPAVAFMAITVGVVAVTKLLTRQVKIAALAGGLLVPALLPLVSVVLSFDTDVEGPPPGMVIGAAIMIAAIAAPITMLFSYFTARLLSRAGKPTGG